MDFVIVIFVEEFVMNWLVLFFRLILILEEVSKWCNCVFVVIVFFFEVDMLDEGSSGKSLFIEEVEEVIVLKYRISILRLFNYIVWF